MVTRIAIVVGALVLVLVVGLVYLFLLRSPVRGTSSVDADVTIECTASTGVSADACLSWGDGIIAQGQPSFRFEMEDLVRLRFDRSLWGFGSDCEADYFIGRYPHDVVWTEEVRCEEG